MLKEPPIRVPAGIRYIGNWDGFDFSNFPKKCILDKKLPGCGLTEYCIQSHNNLILCSPRKILLQNKFEQHPGEVYLVRNEMDSDVQVDIDLTVKRPKRKPESKEFEDSEKTGIVQRINTELRQYISGSLGKSKILVTYDSFWIVKDFLKSLGILDQFFIVIDEFQAILQDSRFKSCTELEFLETLSDCQSIFVSATPMLEEYVDQIPEFHDIPYYELDWITLDPLRLVKPNIEVKLMRSVTEQAIKIIREFKGQADKYFAKTYTVDQYGNPREVKSVEAVFYVNSVDKLTSIIKESGLSDSEVNILCSNTEENQKKIWRKLKVRKTDGLYKIGRVPLKGEPRKTFTFCTRTVYLGADFYSDNAVSYIFSDANSDSLAVDISMDLPQILGRQRLPENPWKNEATLYYKTTADFRKMSKEDFEAVLEMKINKTYSLINNYARSNQGEKEALFDPLELQVVSENYKKNYLSFDKNPKKVDKDKYQKELNFTFNNLVYLSEKRAFDIQQGMYADKFAVFSNLSEITDIQEQTLNSIKVFFDKYSGIKKISDRLKYLCEFSEDSKNSSIIQVILDQIPETDLVKKYFVLGTDECKACGYNVTYLNKKLNIVLFSEETLKLAIYYQFKEGDKYSMKAIKTILTQIYDTISYPKAPKATDLQEFFKLRTINIEDSGKRAKGYELIKKLL